MGVVLATRQVLGTPAEQERHACAVSFFPLSSVFLPSEKPVLRQDVRPLSHKYCLRSSIEIQFDTELGDKVYKFARIYIFSL